MKKIPAMTCLRSIHDRPARPATSARWLALALALPFVPVLTPALAQTQATPPRDAAAVSAPAAAANATAPAAAANPASPLEPFGWLQGCWDGKVNQRDFREEWLPLRGEMMIGVSHTVAQGKTQDFEYLRLESRPEGVFYVAVPSGKKETSFRFSTKTLDGEREIFTFENPVDEFPQRIVYRRGTEGWLYAQVEGKLDGQSRNVTYPMRRVDCASGEVIRK
jgi:Domain of unknown function (DUF6265)